VKFTKEEKRVIAFILAAILAGSIIAYYKKTCPLRLAFLEYDTEKIKESKKININTADEKKLIRIRGIGPVMAGRIINYRNQEGPFLKCEDLKNVKGIGNKTYEKIKNQIRLN